MRQMKVNNNLKTLKFKLKIIIIRIFKSHNNNYHLIKVYLITIRYFKINKIFYYKILLMIMNKILFKN